MHPITTSPRVAPFALVLALGLLVSCSDSPSLPAGVLVVSVTSNQGPPEAGKLVEVVGTGLAGTTGEDGLAEFELDAGHYTVRIYDINTPGPPPPYVEKGAAITSGETTRIEVVDCTWCRAPSGGPDLP